MLGYYEGFRGKVAISTIHEKQKEMHITHDDTP